MFHYYPPGVGGGGSTDANDPTGFSSDTNDTACVISPDARIIISS